MSYENPWLWQGEIFDSDQIGKYVAFVYLLTHLPSGKLYVGKKLFQKRKTKQVKKKKKRFKVDSDWKEYYGSNAEFQALVVRDGSLSVKREILHLCLTKGTANYLESLEQFERRVLENVNYANEWIMCKVHRSHIKY